MLERQHVDPDWQHEPYHNNSFPDEYYHGSGTNVLHSSMWKVQSGDDYDRWLNASSQSETSSAFYQRTHPVLDYGAPNLLYASWQETASMDPTHNGSQAGVSDEWQSMEEVCPSLALDFHCRVLAGKVSTFGDAMIHHCFE